MCSNTDDYSKHGELSTCDCDNPTNVGEWHVCVYQVHGASKDRISIDWEGQELCMQWDYPNEDLLVTRCDSSNKYQDFFRVGQQIRSVADPGYVLESTVLFDSTIHPSQYHLSHHCSMCIDRDQPPGKFQPSLLTSWKYLFAKNSRSHLLADVLPNQRQTLETTYVRVS